MGKTCAFLGNNYDKHRSSHYTPPNLKEKLEKEIINLIENQDVTTFFVGEIGGYEIDAYDVVLEVQKKYPQICILLVISQMTELHKMGDNNDNYIIKRRGFDDFILPPKCEFGYKRLSIVYRNRFIIENTDFIIAYNRYEGKAHKFCKQAQNKGITVIELGKTDISPQNTGNIKNKD